MKKKYNPKAAAHVYIKPFMCTHTHTHGSTHARTHTHAGMHARTPTLHDIYTSLQTHSGSPVTDCTRLLVDMVPKLVGRCPSEPLSLDTLWGWPDQRQQAASRKRRAHCWRSCPGCIQQRMLWLAASAEPASLHTGTFLTLANDIYADIFWMDLGSHAAVVFICMRVLALNRSG